MTDRWKLIKEIRKMAPNLLETEVQAPADSLWFKGHFPGEPILPGVALVHTVFEAIEQDARNRGETVAMMSLKKVRFTGPVRPGDTFLLHISGEDGDAESIFNFKVALEDKVICTGQMTVTKNGEDQKG